MNTTNTYIIPTNLRRIPIIVTPDRVGFHDFYDVSCTLADPQQAPALEGHCLLEPEA
jgi:hypothetical protein